MPKKILLAEDDLMINRALKTYLEKFNYEVFSATNGQEAIDIFNGVKIDLVVLDIMMPKMNGYEVLQAIRSGSGVPVILTTALGEEDNVLRAYHLKADDYFVKPFSPKVLVAKIDHLLQRLDQPEEVLSDFIIGNLKINFSTYQIFVDNRSLALSQTEFRLLTFLIKNKDKVCSRALILDELWGLDVYVDDRIIDTYIKKIRKQLHPYDYIKTTFGVGYRFDMGGA